MAFLELETGLRPRSIPATPSWTRLNRARVALVRVGTYFVFLAALAGCRPLFEETRDVYIFATSPDGSRFAAAMPEYEFLRASDNRSRIVVWVGNSEQYYGDDSESRIVWTSEAAAPLYLFWIDDRTLEIVIPPGTSVSPGSIGLRPSEEVTIRTVFASEIALDSICDSNSLTEIPVAVDDSRSRSE